MGLFDKLFKPEAKSVVKSKTMWLNILLATIAMKVPAVHEWMRAFPEESVAVITVANMLIRIFSSGAVKLW